MGLIHSITNCHPAFLNNSFHNQIVIGVRFRSGSLVPLSRCDPWEMSIHFKYYSFRMFVKENTTENLLWKHLACLHNIANYIIPAFPNKNFQKILWCVILSQFTVRKLRMYWSGLWLVSSQFPDRGSCSHGTFITFQMTQFIARSVNRDLMKIPSFQD